MGFKIEDGKGSGRVAEVTESNKLQTVTVSHTELFEHSVFNRDAYSWSSGTYNYDANDTILLVENTSSTQMLHIHSVHISGDTDTRVIIHRPTSDVTVAGTTVTGVNLNGASGKVADANAARDETGNTQGDVLWSGEIIANGNPTILEFHGAIVLDRNQSIGVDFVTDGSACDVVIMGFFVNR
jgi:hypothetical protein